MRQVLAQRRQKGKRHGEKLWKLHSERKVGSMQLPEIIARYCLPVIQFLSRGRLELTRLIQARGSILARKFPAKNFKQKQGWQPLSRKLNVHKKQRNENSTLFQYKFSLFNDGYLTFCFKLYHSRLYKSHEVLQNTVT